MKEHDMTTISKTLSDAQTELLAIRYLTTAQAAVRCGVKRATILAWLQRGHLAGTKWGRDWRLLALAVDACAADRPGPGRPKNVQTE